MSYRYDPTRHPIHVADPRLNRLLVRNPERCASISEYAQASGIDTTRIVELLGPYLDEGSLAIEVAGDEIFVLTAPRGRPLPLDVAEVAPNLWEALRTRAGVQEAYVLWRLVRGLEASGWRVHTHPARITFGMADLASPPILGVDVGNSLLPLVVHPSVDDLSDGSGLLAEYDRAGAGAVGIVCQQGYLDEMVTAVRRWSLSRRAVPTMMSVLVLEAPRFNPTLLSPGDASVTPRAVTRTALDSFDWGGRA